MASMSYSRTMATSSPNKRAMTTTPSSTSSPPPPPRQTSLADVLAYTVDGREVLGAFVDAGLRARDIQALRCTSKTFARSERFGAMARGVRKAREIAPRAVMLHKFVGAVREYIAWNAWNLQRRMGIYLAPGDVMLGEPAALPFAEWSTVRSNMLARVYVERTHALRDAFGAISTECAWKDVERRIVRDCAGDAHEASRVLDGIMTVPCRITEMIMSFNCEPTHDAMDRAAIFDVCETARYVHDVVIPLANVTRVHFRWPAYSNVPPSLRHDLLGCATELACADMVSSDADLEVMARHFLDTALESHAMAASKHGVLDAGSLASLALNGLPSSVPCLYDIDYFTRYGGRNYSRGRKMGGPRHVQRLYEAFRTVPAAVTVGAQFMRVIAEATSVHDSLLVSDFGYRRLLTYANFQLAIAKSVADTGGGDGAVGIFGGVILGGEALVLSPFISKHRARMFPWMMRTFSASELTDAQLRIMAYAFLTDTNYGRRGGPGFGAAMDVTLDEQLGVTGEWVFAQN